MSIIIIFAINYEIIKKIDPFSVLFIRGYHPLPDNGAVPVCETVRLIGAVDESNSPLAGGKCSG